MQYEGFEVAKLFKEVFCLTRNSMGKIFEGTGLTGTQAMVVRILGWRGKMKISELSEKMGLSNSTVSGLIDRMERQGVVERIRSEEDKRVVYVTVSPRFEEMHRDFHQKADEYMESLLRQADPEDMEKVISGLNALKKILKDHNR